MFLSTWWQVMSMRKHHVCSVFGVYSIECGLWMSVLFNEMVKYFWHSIRRYSIRKTVSVWCSLRNRPRRQSIATWKNQPFVSYLHNGFWLLVYQSKSTSSTDPMLNKMSKITKLMSINFSTKNQHHFKFNSVYPFE